MLHLKQLLRMNLNLLLCSFGSEPHELAGSGRSILMLPSLAPCGQRSSTTWFDRGTTSPPTPLGE